MASDDHRSAAEIEREIEEERAALSRTLDEIQDRLSFEALSGDVVNRVKEHGGDIGRTAVRTVRDNPMPFAIAAAGLTLLALGYSRYASEDDPYGSAAPGPGPERSSSPNAPNPYAGYYKPERDIGGGGSRWERARGALRDAGEASSESLAAAERRAASAWSRARGGFASETESARHGAEEGFRSARDGARSGLDRARAGFERASHAARQRAQGVYASASEMRERILEGTEELSEEARARILAARTRAYEAQLRAEHYATRGREKAADMFEEQPLVAGALAFALGAAVGSILPRTRHEDNAIGHHRDRVVEEAERIYNEERARLEAAARAAASEARDAARDAASAARSDAKSAAQEASDRASAKVDEAEARAKDAASRVADKAKEAANDKKVGNS